MAISSFGRGKGGDDMMAAEPSSASSANLTAFIDQGSEFEGKLTFKDTVRIDGTFSGEITSENTLIVGETGNVDAKIRSNTVVVSGTVVGNIIATRQIVLHKSAKVQGDMSAPSLMIEEGAVFNGQLTMGGRGEAKSGSAAPLKSIEGGFKGSPPERKDEARNQNHKKHS